MTRPLPQTVRADDWPERLAAFFEERREATFEWGKHDCALFAADAMQAMTGVDPLEQFRGYSTEEEGDAILAEFGGMEPLLDAALTAAGAMRCDPAFAQRGDFVLLDVGNQPTCGVWAGEYALAPGADRLYFVPRHRVLAAWAV